MSKKRLDNGGLRILITGGAGFIGSNLVSKLAPKNQVVVVDNFHRNSKQYFSWPKQVKVINGDITNPETLAQYKGSVDIVMHLAAIAGVSNYSKVPVTTMLVNFLGTNNVLAWAKRKQAKLVINFSSSEVYGPHAVDAKETQPTVLGPVGEPRWTYAASKISAEHLCMAYWRQWQLPVVSLRPFNIYGPGQVGEGAIQLLINQALKNEVLVMNGSGEQTRAWCYVDDMVDAVTKVMTNKSAVGQVLNIGNPKATVSVRQLAKLILKLTGSLAKIKSVPLTRAEIFERWPDIARARRLLGWSPQVGLTLGLQKTIDWYRRHQIISQD